MTCGELEEKLRALVAEIRKPSTGIASVEFDKLVIGVLRLVYHTACEVTEAEIRDLVLEEAFNLRLSKPHPHNSAQFNEGYYAGLEAYRQAIRALKSQVSVTGASHDK